MRNPNRRPSRFQMRPVSEIGSFLCRFPDSELVWTAPMLVDGTIEWSSLGTVEFDMIDEDLAAQIHAIADRLFPRARRCYGAQTAHGLPDCDGFPTHPYRVRTDEGRTFTTTYCGDCAAEAPSHHLTLTRLDK